MELLRGDAKSNLQRNNTAETTLCLAITDLNQALKNLDIHKLGLD